MSSLFGIGGGGNVGASGGSFYPYSIDQSLRFNDDDSAYLNRTPSSDGNRQIFTYSVWFKIGNTGITHSTLFSVNDRNSGNYNFIRLSSDALRIQLSGGGSNYAIQTNQVFRDVSSWYHLVLSVDTTQATSTDRVKIYINGEQVTSFSTENYPSVNKVLDVNSDTEHRIGSFVDYGRYFDGYMAEINMIDGTALDASSFGETINNIWVPKNVSGLTYGTNGFYLSFADSAAIGDDLSGNANDFTANNLAASDVGPSSPTNNFATLNPLQNSGGGGTWFAQATLSEGNLKASLPANSVSCATMKATGKLYAEVRWSTIKNELALGLIIPEEYTTTTAHPTNTGANSWRMAYSGGAPADIFLVDEGTSVANPAQTVSAGDIFQIAWDTDSGEIWFGYNNSWYDSSGGTTGNPSTGANPTMTATTADLEASLVYIACGNNTGVGTINFGQDSTFAGAISAGGNADANGIGDFAYAPPTDYLCLAASSLSEPTISPKSAKQADDYFNTVLYTGDGSSSNAITAVGFQPDWVSIKNRSNARSGINYDVIRGANSDLRWDSTAAEDTSVTNQLLSFDADGFTVGDKNNLNGNNETFVAWNWKAGGTAVSNSDGSITSSVSAAPDAGFSITSWVGTGSAGTIGHGLSSAVEMIIVKNRETSGNWHVYHKDTTDAPNDVLFLNLTNADTDQDRFNDTTPTDSVFSINDSDAMNKSGDGIIAYCFHSVDGYSKVGSYVGNASTDGTFVYTGFRPAFVLLKVSSTTNNWFIYDNKREGYNQENDTLSPNDSSAEDNSYKLDLLSNGFKIRGSNNAHNHNGQTFIYLAFAEAPFKYANAR